MKTRGIGDVIRVLHSSPRPSADTSYGSLMKASSSSDVVDLFFSWRIALTGKYDVVHLHWPEALLRDPRRPRRILKRVLTIVLLIRLRVRRIPVVRTAHNLHPHEPGGRLENALLRVLDRSTAAFISLNGETTVPERALNALVPHPSYVTSYSKHGRKSPLPGRLLYFGMIRPYKGIESLISEFSRIEDPAIDLRLVGSSTSALASKIEKSASIDGRISYLLEFVDDRSLVSEITRASLVVLPYKAMHNSGAVLAALSLGRRVLVPRNSVNTSLAAEVGHGWIEMYEGELSADALLAALRAETPQGEPNLESRSMESIGARLSAVYRSVLTK